NKILCVDMKSFFASVEAVDRGWDPLKACVAVVGDHNRSGAVVLAASSALKDKYNIRTGNRLYEIPRIPEIKIVDARMGLYLKRSLEITLLFREFVPLDAIHVYSIDESWLKLDGTERRLGNNWQAALKIKERLMEEFALPSSMGMGPNMFLAKVAMDIEGKKKGLAEWKYEDVQEKLWPVPLKECWGIGSRLSRYFTRLGIKTVGELAQLPLDLLEKKFGIMGNQLYYHAWGVDLSKVEGHYKDKHKALGRGITLFKDYKDIEEIKTVIFELAEEVAKRARDKNLLGKTITLGLGYSKGEKGGGFHVQRTIQKYTNSTFDVYEVALALLAENYQDQLVRQINLSLGNLTSSSARQLNLFEDKVSEIELNKTKDALQDKYGYKALFFGKSLRSGSVKERIKTTIGGHGR
ncbi:MAG: DNA polymerase thumb domain-containing protein, partial [Bacillota bacterium]